MLGTTSTLLAAARSGSARPHVRLQIADRDAGAVRLRFARWYEGAEPDGPCAAASPADGSLVRAWWDPTDGRLYVQRIATPSAESAFDAWTELAQDALSVEALGLHAAGTRVLLAIVNSAGVLRVVESTDSGATWGSWVTVASTASYVALGCAVRADGSALAAWATDDGVVRTALRGTGGSWGTASEWDHALDAVHSLAVSDQVDWAVLVSGVDGAGRAGCWSTQLGSGLGGPPGEWSALTPLVLASPGTGVTYRGAGIAQAGVPRALLLERYEGGDGGAGAFDRAMLATALAGATFVDGAWRDPVPLEIEAPYGLGAARVGDALLLCRANGVWGASAESALVDVGARVLEARYEASASVGSFGGGLAGEGERLRFVLGTSECGEPASMCIGGLAVGGEVAFAPGYVTDGGYEFSSGRALWITSVRRELGRVTVEAEEAFGLLSRWRASRQLTWEAGTRSIAQIASEIGRLAGLAVSATGASEAAQTLQPAFSIAAGERGSTALSRLLAKTSDVAFGRGARIVIAEADPEAEPVAAFGWSDALVGNGHPLYAHGEIDAGERPGWARVFGDGVVAQAVDGAAVSRGGGIALAVDEALTTSGVVLDRAEAVLRSAWLGAEREWIAAAPHPALEPGDVIEVGGEPRRVVSVRLHLARRPVGRYAMRLGLGYLAADGPGGGEVC